MSNLERISAERRTFLGSTLTSMGLFSFLSACGGSAATEQELMAQASSLPFQLPFKPFVPPTVAVPGLNRTTQTYLFQNVPQPYPSAVGGASYVTDWRGPNYHYVDSFSGWRWTHPGGDWIDVNGIAQGPAAYASFSDPAGPLNTYTTYSTINVTGLLQYVQSCNKWCAFHISSASGIRAMCSNWHTSQPAPLISVNYTDGTSATLACRFVGRLNGSTAYPITLGDEPIIDPNAIEFERPTRPVASATLRITIIKKNSAAATIRLNPCNPPVNVEPMSNMGGLAAAAGTLDANITGVSGVIGAQRYLDGTTLSDFALVGSKNVSAESNYDPAMWGGATDTSKLPHTSVGKWVNAPAALVLVNSSYAGEGFAPLAPGLGALKLTMANESVPVGTEVRNSGTAAIISYLFMPIEKMGLLSHIFTRQYLRLGTPHVRKPADRREVLRFGNPTWSDMAGKMGISPSHNTAYGGFSGSSGGSGGWQLRWAWTDCESNVGGPNEGGTQVGWHLWDFGSANPPGYRYSSESQAVNNWGQQGGLGATLYAGRWYEIETEVKLNTVNAWDNSYLADGLLRVWIDGRLCYERTGMVFRTLPRATPGYNPGALRPFRELGVGWLLWNWYHGGLTASTVERTTFTTGLVWAEQRIGAMRGATTG